MESVRAGLPAMLEMIERARREDVPVVYVNDNHGAWNACRPELVEHALGGRAPALVEPIVPVPDDPFIVKARHSIFYQTQVEYFLRQHDIDRFVLIGQVTEQCILYSALDGYVRHFQVGVASDAVAAIDPGLSDAALRMMARNMHAQIDESHAFEL
jgi:nicotinamidase-related amidase